MIVAVDFDGTLCEDRYPEIGRPMQAMIEIIKGIKKSGHKVILWTCRCGRDLNEAVKWCTERGIEFDAVNDNLPENVEKYQNNSRKINADFYIDDKSLLIGPRYNNLCILMPRRNGKAKMKKELETLWRKAR